MESLCILSGSGLLCFLACYLASRILPPDFLAAKQTSRSNHAGSPRQLGGLALVPSTFMIAAITLALSSLWQAPPGLTILGLVMAFLLGFADDWKGLGVKTRLVVQLAIAALLVVPGLFPETGPDIDFIILTIIGLVAVTYWINAVNFMDGLDWMLVGGLIVPLVFHAVLLAHTGSDEGSGMGLLALCAGGCLIGFAYWNRPAAVLFMGDGGSLFLGALSAATILQVSLTFGVIIAVTPFLYFLMDTSSTIMLRLAAGDNIFHAHSQHAYQFAFRNGRSAVRITVAVAVLNLGLAALGILMLMSTDWAVYCLFAFACLITGLFSLRLRQYPDQRRPA